MNADKWKPGTKIAEGQDLTDFLTILEPEISLSAAASVRRIEREIEARMLSNLPCHVEKVNDIHGKVRWERPKKPSLWSRFWRWLTEPKRSPFRQG